MISVNLAYNGYVGLSTDTKPIEDVNNGSMFYEMDTQKKYMFDAEGAEWIEQTAEGGGGGGNADTVKVTMSWDDSLGVYTLDKTYDEISAIITDGKFPYIVGHNSGAILFPAECQSGGAFTFASVFRCANSTGYGYSIKLSSDDSVISYNTQITASTHEDGD